MTKRESIHFYTYFLLLVLIGMSLPLSEFALSASMLLLAINYLVEGDFRRKLGVLKNRKSIAVAVLIFMVHIVWLVFSDDLHYGLNDIKDKLPFLSLPIIIGTSKPLKFKWFKIIVWSFMLSVTFATFVSTAIYLDIIEHQVKDIREISLYISHIRFALMIDLSIFAAAWFVFRSDTKSIIEKTIYILLMCWWIFFFAIMQSLSGYGVLLVTLLIVLIIIAFRIKKKRLMVLTVFVLVSLPLILGGFIFYSVIKFYNVDVINPDELEMTTSEGNNYDHDLTNKHFENGHYIGLYRCETELRRDWNIISKIDYDGKDYKGQDLKYTLWRYMTSLGLRKDASGLKALTSKDISMIENGEANYIFSNKLSPYALIYKSLWQIDMYQKTDYANGQSLSLRFEYLKGAFTIISENYLLGVGTGDLQQAFTRYYEESKSTLPEKQKRRTHNQYITFIIAFGIIGFLIVTYSIFNPIWRERKNADLLFYMFFIIALISMLYEDTLDSQTGIAFYSYFYFLLLFGREVTSPND